MKKLYALLGLIVFLFSSYSYAQTVSTSTNRKAIKEFKKAYKELSNRHFTDAITYGKLAVKEDALFVEAYILIAESYSFLKDCDYSCYYYQKALNIDIDHSPKTYLAAAYENMYCGDPNQAIKYFDIFFLKRPDGERNQGIYPSYKLCQWRTKMMKDSLLINPQNMGKNINSSWSEYLPTLKADETELIFTVRRPSDSKTKCLGCKEEEDFYVSKKLNGEWTKRTSLGHPINTPYNEGAQCISPDGKYLIFTGCDREDGIGSCDLYWSKRIGEIWSKPRNFGKPVNSRYWESQPTFSADGKTILFASNRPGGVGNIDIWSTTMIAEGDFSEPVNLGQPINTMKDEISPFLHPDGVTLYFASTGHQGMGGEDIFYSVLQEEGQWSEPVNMGYPINTVANEFNLIVNARGDKAFFSSSKKGGFGGLDLYWFELPEFLRPLPVTYFKGKIFDSKDGKPLEALFEVIDLKTNRVVVSSSSDPLTGEFLICIPTNSHYALNAIKEHYLFYSENFEMNGEYSKLEPYEKNVALKRIELGESIILKNVFFDTDKSDLKQESEVELNRLFTLMQQNPQMKVEISGHTDNVGNREHNAVLSQNRAKEVFGYLVNKGINADRMNYAGYGFDKPVSNNDTPEGRALNRRTEFTIIGF
ncbi:MAG: OmpA family protein [Bacteroidales bacterium]|jgi:outer membrane protein OmpA-like peptidoglycan-associated protein/tetratricopeptide (TPR) repeat protein|nr:OmpA family protein [Bacteroidales bacterium]